MQCMTFKKLLYLWYAVFVCESGVQLSVQNKITALFTFYHQRNMIERKSQCASLSYIKTRKVRWEIAHLSAFFDQGSVKRAVFHSRCLSN